jgi:uncharacterized protein YbjT (DUF2867 family)
VRCLARRPEEARRRLDPGVDVVGGDLQERDSLHTAFTGVRAAFYLVHALAATGDLWELETNAARNFVKAAQDAGVERLIYLGGLADSAALSPHLATRREVGRILRGSGIPTIELRASIVLGSGSLSFEMIRALVERLPIMITPRWVRRKAQPIAIEDVIEYLVAALELPLEGSEVVEIGGAEQVSYLELLREYAHQRGLHRVFLPVPVLTPELSSLWIGLITPVQQRTGRKLIESVRHDTVVTSPRARELFPWVRPRGMRAAIERALVNEDRESH